MPPVEPDCASRRCESAQTLGGVGTEDDRLCGYLESPGTKAYSVAEARALFADFSDVQIRTVLTHGDLLESGAGQRHRGALLTVARRVWPRGVIRRVLPGAGLFMLIQAVK